MVSAVRIWPVMVSAEVPRRPQVRVVALLGSVLQRERWIVPWLLREAEALTWGIDVPWWV